MYSGEDELSIFKLSLEYMENSGDFARALHMTDHGPLHAQRVYAICRWIGSMFPLTVYEFDLLRVSALLHDIGMASANRENHNKESEDIVINKSKENKIPFSEEEAKLVGKLCLWHRGDYERECKEICEGNEIQTGLLASLLRLSDELDLDYRRTEFISSEDMEITKQYKEDQIEFHKAVLNILGVRVKVEKSNKYFELICNDTNVVESQIERLKKEIYGTPLEFTVELLSVKNNNVQEVKDNGKAIIYAYCNPHGLLTAMLSKISLKLEGIDSDIICSKDETKDAFSFWEDIDKEKFSDYKIACFIDLNIDSEAIRKLEEIFGGDNNCKVFISCVTLASNEYISKLIEIGITLFLGDEHVLFYAKFLNNIMPFWIKVSGLCNIDNISIQKIIDKESYDVVNGLKYAMFKYFKDDKSISIESIMDKIENDDKDFFIEYSKKFYKEIDNTNIKSVALGRVALIRIDNDINGRFVYDWIIHAIMKNKCYPYEKFEFSTPYAIFATKKLRNNEIRVLFFSYFKNRDKLIPMRYFLKKNEGIIGKDNTIWKKYKCKDEAINDMKYVIHNINKEYYRDNDVIDCDNFIYDGEKNNLDLFFDL